MKTSIKKELLSYIKDLKNDRVLTEENKDEWHYLAFNQDYYIIGYYNASQWLKKHDLDPFEAIQTCIDYERDSFGEVFNDYGNSEAVVNMLAYIYGEELIDYEL